MRQVSFKCLAVVILIGLLPTSRMAFARPVSFKASDGVTVYADLNSPRGHSRGTIILFHMAGSNKSEYLPVAPVLNRVGFTTLAVDQRSGGSRWGDVNETANEVVGGREFASAIPDLEAAIAFGVSLKRGPTAVWGSSYSAALGFIVAARNPEVKALLAFSPAEYIEGYSIQAQASKLTIPVFIASAPTANEVASAKALAQAVPHNRAQQYLPLHGVHGSSMLRNDVNPAGATEIWKQVLKFLDKFLPEGV